MRKTLTLVFALASFAGTVQAQTILIGLNNNQSTGLASVIRWDAATGTMLDSVVTTQPGSLMGSSIYDPVNGQYYFDGSLKICRVGFNPTSFEELSNSDSGYTSNTEIDMSNGNIFSLRSAAITDSLGSIIGFQIEFVRYTTSDSTETVLGILPIGGVYMDLNCFNSNSGTYYFLGLDSLGGTLLGAIPTRTSAFTPTLIPVSSLGINLFTLEYDNDYNILYGLSDGGPSSLNLQVQQIDTLTGALTLEADLPQLNSYLMTTTTYDQASHSMIMVASGANQQMLLYTYNTTSNVLSTLLYPYPGEFGELESDNTVYAVAKYNSSTAIGDEQKPGALALYPNPAQDQLHIAADMPAGMELVDMMGRVIPVTATGSTLDLSNFAPGCYLLRARLADGRVMQSRFLKQ
ncbi:MAG: T9SS C-terminal target domain-containing protein [Bacteroidetes bacterium]|nr:MAG: T9SS C-terminal target domain-containing protein [Bacteroidota bacterium]